MTGLLVLRPEPGAGATVAAAAALGLSAIAAPLFVVEAVAWTPPDPAGFDALMLTSANGVRHAGAALAAVARLPVYAVGAATARAARAAGLTMAGVGEGDGQALAAMMAAAGVASVLHLAGEDVRTISAPRLRIDHRIVYRAAAASILPEAAVNALAAEAVALLHSPRAGAVFARLADAAGIDRARIRLAAISPAAAAAAGAGWAGIVTAAVPSDAALLAAAAGLCEEAAGTAGSPGLAKRD